MRFRKNSQEENWITPHISGDKEKSLKGSRLWGYRFEGDGYRHFQSS